VFDRGEAKDGPGFQFERKEKVVVVGDDPPEVGDLVNPVAVDDGVETVVVARRYIDALARADGVPVSITGKFLTRM
jgi:hypothetical protein